MEGQGRQILGLDLVRFAAAVLVMSLHLRLDDIGWIGVQVFFVLSGVVIAYSAERASPKQFLVSRVARLVPAALICATASFLIVIWLDGYSHEAFVSYLHAIFFWPSPPWIVIVYWTLHVEVGFYAIVFLLLLIGPYRRIFQIAAAISIWSTVYNVLPGVFDHVPVWFRQITMAEFGCLFALGIFLRFLRNEPFRLLTLTLICLSALGCGFEINHFGASRGSTAIAAAPEIVFFSLAVGMWLALRYDEYFWRVLGRFAAQIRMLGLATYPMYLIHYSLIYLIGSTTQISGIPFSVVCASMAIIASLAISAVLEPPIARMIRRSSAMASRGALRTLRSRLSAAK